MIIKVENGEIHWRVAAVRATGKGAPSRPDSGRVEVYDIELMRRLRAVGFAVRPEFEPYLTEPAPAPGEVA